jgi:hypothetical protein
MIRTNETILRKKIKTILESYESSGSLSKFIRHQLELIYKPLGMWGRAPNPNDDCQTNVGVINIFPHSENDKWSILNRFDTNLKVKKRLEILFTQNNEQIPSSISFENWIEQNRNDLFGPDGKYTKDLVDLNMDTIINGNKNEEYAVEVLKQRFPGTNIKRYCSGDIRDTIKGIDIKVEHETRPFNVQVKPIINVNSYSEPDGTTFFEVTCYLDTSKYSEKNVDVFMFVNSKRNHFILFKNKKNKITQIESNLIRFYEPPIYTNMNLKTEEK